MSLQKHCASYVTMVTTLLYKGMPLMLHHLRKKLDRAASENPIARAARTSELERWSAAPHFICVAAQEQSANP
jgi:hypothetical protein